MKQKLAEEYFKYLLTDGQIASKALNSLFRIYFLSLIAFVFAPTLSINVPELFKIYKIFFIVVLMCAIAGILCEFISTYFAQKGARETAGEIFERAKNWDDKSDIEELVKPVGNYHIYCRVIFVLKTIFAAVRGFAMSWPLLSWLGNLK